MASSLCTSGALRRVGLCVKRVRRKIAGIRMSLGKAVSLALFIAMHVVAGCSHEESPAPWASSTDVVKFAATAEVKPVSVEKPVGHHRAERKLVDSSAVNQNRKSALPPPNSPTPVVVPANTADRASIGRVVGYRTDMLSLYVTETSTASEAALVSDLPRVMPIYRVSDINRRILIVHRGAERWLTPTEVRYDLDRGRVEAPSSATVPAREAGARGVY